MWPIIRMPGFAADGPGVVDQFEETEEEKPKIKQADKIPIDQCWAVPGAYCDPVSGGAEGELGIGLPKLNC